MIRGCLEGKMPSTKIENQNRKKENAKKRRKANEKFK